MYLKNLNALYVDMQQNDADSVVFAAQVEGHPFSCTFATVTSEFHLFVTALGKNPFTIDIQVDSNFNVASGLYLPNDLYEKLAHYLGVKKGRGATFRPISFIQKLDYVTPTRYNGNCPARHNVAVLAMTTNPKKYDDIDKPYFCGWYRNPAGKSVREKNRNKSLLYFSAKEVELRTRLNMSSCWSDNPDDEVLTALNQLVADKDIT